jgi:hypothetical protein
MRPCVPYNWNHSRNQYDQTDKHNCFWLDIVCENFIILQTLNMLPFYFNPTYKMDEMGYNYIFWLAEIYGNINQWIAILQIWYLMVYGLWFMMFQATFNNISVISWRLVWYLNCQRSTKTQFEKLMFWLVEIWKKIVHFADFGRNFYKHWLNFLFKMVSSFFSFNQTNKQQVLNI